jgi:hypothetical protein
MTPLFKKLNLGELAEIVVLNEPESFNTELEALTDVTIHKTAAKAKQVQFGIGFAVTQKELDKVCAALAKAEGDVIIWIAYPKQSSKKYKCEFNRDTGLEVIGKLGFEPVKQVAIDEDWSALRFRRVEFIATLTRGNSMALSEQGKARTKKSS